MNIIPCRYRVYLRQTIVLECVMNKKSIRDIQWQGKRAVVRVDFNVPIEHGQITIPAVRNEPLAMPAEWGW